MPTEIVEGFQLSPQQEHLWLVQRLDQSPAYCVQLAILIEGNLNAELLWEAVQRVIDRHEILHTTFYCLPGMTLPIQVISDSGIAWKEQQDLSGCDPLEQAALVEARFDELRLQPFDLERGPLVRLSLIALSPARHVLLIGLPALCGDLMSLKNGVREICCSYAALLHGEEYHAEPMQYADFATWQNELIESEDAEAERAYWRNQDIAAQIVLELPFERRPSDGSVFRPDMLSRTIGADRVAKIEALVRQYGVSMSLFFLVCWQVLLWRLTAQSAIIVGAHYGGRRYPELQEAFGLFARYLPLQSNLKGSLQFDKLLKQVIDTVEQIDKMQEFFSWEPLVTASKDLKAPLFCPFCFDFEEQNPIYSAHDVSFSVYKHYACIERFKVKLSCINNADSLTVTFHYDPDFIQAEDIKRLAERFDILVESAANHPSAIIGSLAILSEAERRQLLVEFNYPQIDYPHDTCIHRLFEEQVARTPDAIALVFDDRSASGESPRANAQHITYTELNRRANQLAHHLRHLGVGPEVRVAICVERSFGMMIGILGILKAGGAYVPLDPAYPQERLSFMLADAQAQVLLTNLDFAQRLPAHTARVVCLDQDWAEIASARSENPASALRPDNLAYTIYTSGSTGTPKGVLVTHRNLVHSTHARLVYYQEPIISYLLLSSFAFDSSVTGIFWTLCQGGCLTLPQEGLQWEVTEIAQLIAQQQISHMLSLPSFCALLLQEAHPQQLASLRVGIVAGEPCPRELVEHYHELIPGALLVNEYGPTEGTVWSSAHTCRFEPPEARVPIGHPIANTQIYLLDAFLQPVPAGVPGELYIGGAGLARGYHNQSGLTAERFVPNPFSVCRLQIADCRLAQSTIYNLQSAIGERLYRTGDLARYRSDGTIEFLGRIDDQVKIRGYRIELGEIEAVLGSHPGVGAALVIAREDVSPASGYPERRLVAYVVPTKLTGDAEQETRVRSQKSEVRSQAPDDGRWTMDDGNDSEPSSFVVRPSSFSEPSSFVVRRSSFVPELRTFLQERLPGYMVPAAFMLLDTLPLTANGKVDRRALPAPDSARPELAGAYVIPRGPIQEVLANIWAEVLGVERVGINDNFFDLGGHSLATTKITSRVRDAFQVELPLRSLFEMPTVAALAERIEADRSTAAELTTPPLLPLVREDVAPLSYAQQRLWFLDQLEPGNPFYNISAAIQLTGPLNVEVLQQSFTEVVRRHEALRTTFMVLDGQPVQVTRPALPLSPPVIDLQPLPEPVREAEARRHATREAQRSFDLVHGPLIRAVLLRLSMEEHLLLLTLHHIVSDGWSMGVLVREVAPLYDAFTAGMRSPLPELPIQYADYACWQRGWLEGEGDHTGSPLQTHLAYWQRQLAGAASVLALPTDRPRRAIQMFHGGVLPFKLPNTLSEALQALSRRASATLFMTLLAAFQLMLRRYTGQDDIVVGSPNAHRNRAEIEGLIGFFVNQLVLRTDLSGNPTFRALLGRVREVCLGAYAHEDLPFEKLVEALQPERSLSHTPIFQIMFVIHNELSGLPEELVLAGPLHCRARLPVENGTAKRDLSLHMIDGSGGLVGFLEYDTDLFDKVTVVRMANHLQVILESIVATPQQPISTVPILTKAERHQLLLDWNDTTLKVRSQESGVRINHPVSDLLASDFWLLTSDSGCVHHLFEAQAARTPDAIALIFDGRLVSDDRQATADAASAFGVQQITYRALNQRANQVAHYLRPLGVGPEVLVGICMERSPALIIGILGILKAGGVYVPLDPAYPGERLAFMLADAQVAVLITTNDQRPTTSPAPCQLVSLSACHATVVDLSANWPSIIQHSLQNPDHKISGENLAYVIYTSGSLGAPKGVMITHINLSRYVQAMEQALRVSADDHYLHTASFAFSSSVRQLLVPLTHGAAVVIATAEQVLNPSLLFDLVKRQGVTIIDLIPTYWRHATDALSRPALSNNTLRLLLSASEPLPSDVPGDWMNHVGRQVRFINMFGQTETTGIVALYPIPNHYDRSATTVSLGRPIANTQIYLLDRNFQPVPARVPADLYVGGRDLSRGYLQQPELTAERFVPNPFLTNDERRTTNAGSEPSSFVIRHSSRLYRTGDQARYRPDGMIEFLGRGDQQVKVRGFRVEPGEIEAALARHPSVREAAVVAREAAPGNQRLVAYIVPTNDEGRRTKDEGSDSSFVLRHSSMLTGLRTFLAARLPDYMVPSAFVVLDKLPLTPNGKIDRRALPQPDGTGPGVKASFVAPHTWTEQTLAQIWAQVLGIERVGATDNFFELGGDSILSIQIIARASQVGLRFTVKQMFQHQTIGELAAVARMTPAIQAEQGLVLGPVPLTPIQRWFFEQQPPNPDEWAVVMLLEVRQTMDVALLKRVVKQLLSHHDVLRLRFTSDETGWQQVNADLAGATPCSRVDLSALPETARRGAAVAVAAELRAGLSLAHGPLLRVAFFDLGTSIPARLLILIHRLVIDGVSWRIVLEDLQVAYCRWLSRDEAIQLAPKTTSFKQWAEQLTAYARSAKARQELAYWLAEPWQLSARLPVDYEDGANTEPSARIVSASLSVEETHALLHTVPETYNTQINDVLLMALGMAITQWAGAPALLVELEGHGREPIAEDIDLSRTVGWFAARFPVLLDMRAGGDPGSALKSVKEQLRRIPNRGIGYGALRYLSDDPEVTEQLRALPQPELSFSYTGQFDQLLADSAYFRVDREMHEAAQSPSGARRYLLEIFGFVEAGRLQLHWRYSEQVHQRATIERATDAFTAALRSLIAHCQSLGTKGYTPSDFPNARLSQQDLDRFIAGISRSRR